MAENKIKTLPKFNSLAELVDSFDNEDWGDYLEQMPEAQFEVELTRNRQVFTLDNELESAEQVS